LALEQNSLIQYNLYAYCLNNPIIRVDIGGQLSVLAAVIIGGAVAGAIVSAISYMANSAVNNQKITLGGLAVNVLMGAASGAIGGLIGTAGLGIKVVASVGVGLGVSTISYITGGDSDDAVWSGLCAAGSCFIGAMIPNNYQTALSAGAWNYCMTQYVGVGAETTSIALQNSSVSFESEINKPVSGYLGGSTKKSCGPYRRGWTQNSAKTSGKRMRSASYFYQNIII